MKPIKMIAWFSEDGVPTPIRFNIRQRDESSLTIKIDKITLRQKEKLAGNHMLVFTGSIINVGVTSRRNEKHKRKPTE